MTRRTYLATLAFTTLLAAGCGAATSSAEPPTDPESQDVESPPFDHPDLVAANNAFALALYARLRDEPGNIFLSPYSISTALAMTYGGARAATAEEMADVLRFDGVGESVHPLFAALSGSIDGAGADEAVELAIANRIWAGLDETILDEFAALVETHYGGGLERVDFATDPEAARTTINAWIETQTRDKIRNLLKPGDVKPHTTLVLTNAIYFKGQWAEQFDPDHTHDLPFHRGADDAVDVAMMARTAAYPFAMTETALVLELPYAGERLSMVVVLPREYDGLADLERKLTAESLDAWIASLTKTRVLVRLPRFQMESRYSLADTLRAMGMTTAFSRGADFSGINGRKNDLFIDWVIHQAYVDVNEEGTEAAAATAVGLQRTSLGPIFEANHPFMFLIRDRETSSVLFMGRVEDPSAEG